MSIEITDDSTSNLVKLSGLKEFMETHNFKVAKLQKVTGIARGTITKAVNGSHIRRTSANVIVSAIADLGDKPAPNSGPPPSKSTVDTLLDRPDQYKSGYIDAELTQVSSRLLDVSKHFQEFWRGIRNQEMRITADEFAVLEADYSRVVSDFDELKKLYEKLAGQTK